MSIDLAGKHGPPIAAPSTAVTAWRPGPQHSSHNYWLYETVAEVRAVNAPNSDVIRINGNGEWKWDATSTATDDGTESTNAIQITGVTTGRYLRNAGSTISLLLPSGETAAASRVEQREGVRAVSVQSGSLLLPAADTLFEATFGAGGTNAPGAITTLVGSNGEVINFSRSGSATVTNALGAEVTATANQARVNPLGLLVEPATTQLLTHADDLTHSDFATQFPTRTAGIADARGGTTAVRHTSVSTNSGGYYTYQSPSITPGALYAFQIEAKYNATLRYVEIATNSRTHYSVFDVQLGVVVSNGGSAVGSVVHLGNGWFRLCMVAPGVSGPFFFKASSLSDFTQVSQPGSIDFCRPQFEAGGYASTWTTTSRAAEWCRIPLPGLPPDWSVEIEAMAISGIWGRLAGATLMSMGTLSAANSWKVTVAANGDTSLTTYDTAGTDNLEVKNIANGGFHTIVISSSGTNSVIRPCITVDGEEYKTTPANSGTGYISPVTPAQLMLYLGGASDGANVGGFVIRSIRVYSSKTRKSKVLGQTGYSKALPAGYVPTTGYFACLGDSNTLGYGDSVDPFCAQVARRMTGRQGHNFGVGSNGTGQLLARWHEHVRPRAYPLVVVWGGINDINADLSSAYIIQRLKTLIDSIVASDSDVLAMALMPGGDAIASSRSVNRIAVNDWLETYCASIGQLFLDTDAIVTDGSPTAPAIRADWQSGNSLHCNQLGHDAISTAMIALLT